MMVTAKMTRGLSVGRSVEKLAQPRAAGGMQSRTATVENNLTGS